MAIIPEPQHTINNLIDKYHESQQSPPRYHFGLSGIGEPCERRLWYQFRWVVIEKFPGRILRLFRRGHREEETVIADLQAIGMVISEQQVNVNLGYGIQGSLDGIIESGVPQAPEKKHVLEIKTHSDKSFRSVKEKGVQESQPKHYAQMQAYMFATNIDRALYVSINKNNDEYYTERVRLDMAFAKKLIYKAGQIVSAEEPPPPISTDPSWYQCKMCPALAVCHQGKPSKEINCRTCVHSTLKPSGMWQCERWDTEIPKEIEQKGCRSHVIRPHLVPWKLMPEKSTKYTACYVIDDQEVMVGEEGYTLSEVLSGGQLNNEIVDHVREVFDGEIIDGAETLPTKNN